MTRDPHNLNRFVQAQEHDYDQALGEIRAGRKRSHWMWYVFPQFTGLGSSPTSVHYAIKSVQEATAYLAHPVLGPRLLRVCRGGPADRGPLSAGDIRLPRRHEAAIVGDAVCVRVARGIGVSPDHRQILRRREGRPHYRAHVSSPMSADAINRQFRIPDPESTDPGSRQLS